MADTVKILNLAKEIGGKKHIITVRDTDGDYGARKIANNSIMGFDKNDKVTVKGDISVFTQKEINEAFFAGYNDTDVRLEGELKDLTKTKLEIKEGKISGDTSKPFSMEDLAKVANQPEKAQAAPQADAAVKSPGPATDWKLLSDAAPAAQTNPCVNSQLSYGSANMVNQVSSFLGSSLSSNFGQSFYVNMPMNNASITNMAKYVWDSVPVQTQANPFQNPTAAAGTTPATTAPATTANPATTTPAAATTTAATTAPAAAAAKEGEAVVSEGEIKDGAPTKTAKGHKGHKGERTVKNANGNQVKIYTNKAGNRFAEEYKNGVMIKQTEFFQDGSAPVTKIPKVAPKKAKVTNPSTAEGRNERTDKKIAQKKSELKTLKAKHDSLEGGYAKGNTYQQVNLEDQIKRLEAIKTSPQLAELERQLVKAKANYEKATGSQKMAADDKVQELKKEIKITEESIEVGYDTSVPPQVVFRR